ncbi:MAG: hypothetical protein HYU36_02350 [Planctomycetes bacterium]|nr:hypothetical protein [Planctomycetota bacterium]
MAHPDLDELLNALYSFAQEMLAKHGEFHPFGVSLSRDGEMALEQGYTGDEHPPSEQMIDTLVGGLRAMAGKQEIRAAGICLDVRVTPPGTTEKSDAICARLEHENGEAVEVYLPYRKGWFGKIKYGEIFAGRGESKVFAGQDSGTTSA